MTKLSGHITLDSITKVLAYCQYYSIPYLSGRGLPARHLQRLTLWLGIPANKLQTIRQHRFLAAHLILVQAANLLQHDNDLWFCSPFVEQWLQQTTVAQYQTLMAAIDRCCWKTVVEQENLSTCFDGAYATFVRQSLERQQHAAENQAGCPASWESFSEVEWQLSLPPNLPLERLFHLLQLGEWNPHEPLRISALTIARARQQGYGINFIEHQLSEAAQQALTQSQQAQLLSWYLAAAHYHVQAAYVLSTAQPDQLAEIMSNRRLSRQVHAQLSPRHALVSPALTTSLTRWLARQNKHLHAPNLKAGEVKNELDVSAFNWLGLKLLIDLKALLALPIPAPHGLLDEAAAALSPEEQTELAFTAQHIMAELKQAVRGKDAFFPAQEAVSQGLIDQIAQAIKTESALTIAYQALGEIKPSLRRIQPLRLESRGNLYYLHAYCYRAETNLTFRLDRVAYSDNSS